MKWRKQSTALYAKYCTSQCHLTYTKQRKKFNQTGGWGFHLQKCKLEWIVIWNNLIISKIKFGCSWIFVYRTVHMHITVIMLAFEEMRNTVQKWMRCVQKFGNAYQWEEIEKQMAHFKSTFTIRFIKRFSEIKCSSQAMHTFLSQYSHTFRDCLPHV